MLDENIDPLEGGNFHADPLLGTFEGDGAKLAQAVLRPLNGVGDFGVFAWRTLVWIVLGVIIIGALASAAMVGSAMPFLAVLSDPSRIDETPANLRPTCMVFQSLALFPFSAGIAGKGVDAVVVAPDNAGFFALGLALLGAAARNLLVN